MEHWEGVTATFHDQSANKLQRELSRHIDEVFGAYLQTELRREIAMIIDEHINLILDDGWNFASRLLDNEKNRKGTLDVDSHRAAEKACTETILKRAQVHQANVFLDQKEPKDKRSTGAERLKAVQRLLDSGQLNEQHPYHSELIAMAKVQAYYQVAANRFVDNLYQTIRVQIFARTASELLPKLEDGLGVMMPDGKCIPGRRVVFVHSFTSVTSIPVSLHFSFLPTTLGSLLIHSLEFCETDFGGDIVQRKRDVLGSWPRILNWRIGGLNLSMKRSDSIRRSRNFLD